MCEVRVGSTAEAFCNIAWRRSRGIANLAVEPEVVLDSLLFRESLQSDLQFSRELPAHEFSKMTRTSHAPERCRSVAVGESPDISGAEPR